MKSPRTILPEPTSAQTIWQANLYQELSFAYKNISRRARRSMLAMPAIVCGITALILASGFIEWILDYGRESEIHSRLGHIRVYKPGYLDSGQADPWAYLLPINAKQTAQLESVRRIRLIAPRLSFNGLISHGESTISFIGEGVDVERERELSRSMTIVAGEGLSPEDPKGITLGQGLADNLGVAPGDTVVLLVNTASGGIGAVEGHVRGLFATVMKDFDDSALRVPIALSRQLLRVSGAHSLALLIDRTANTDSVVAELRERFRGQPLEFVPWYELSDFYTKTAELFSRQVNTVRLIIAVIIILSISNSLIMSVMERTGEIGAMMATGTSRAGILRLFVFEGALLGLFGGIAGLLAGWLAAIGISAIGIPLPTPPGMSFGYTAGIMFTWPIAGQALGLAVATTLFASLYPAWKASRLEIVNALRHNR